MQDHGRLPVVHVSIHFFHCEDTLISRSRSVVERVHIQAFTFSSQDHGRLPAVHVSKHSCVVVCVCVAGVVLWCVLSCAGVVLWCVLLCWCVGVVVGAEEKTHGTNTRRTTWHDTRCVDPHSKQQQTTWKRKLRKCLSPFSLFSLSHSPTLILLSFLLSFSRPVFFLFLFSHCFIKSASNFEAFECDLHSICQRIARNAVTYVTLPPLLLLSTKKNYECYGFH